MTACEWITERQSRCESEIFEELKRLSLPSFTKPTIICIPELKSWSKVCEVNNEIEGLRILHAFANLPFFKIPYFVNNVESYVTMLLREHFQGL